MNRSAFPLLVQVNTRVYLTDLSNTLEHKATLDDIPDSELDYLASFDVDWVWFLSVWQTGKKGQMISRQNPEWIKEFHDTLPDLEEEDIAGSGFAITRYQVSEELGGEAALSRLRKRLADRGMKLMLDFVPNHTGLGPLVGKRTSRFLYTGIGAGYGKGTGKLYQDQPGIR